MKLFSNEVDRNAPLTLLEKVVGALAPLAPIIGILLVGILLSPVSGCKDIEVGGDKNLSSETCVFPEINAWWK